MGKVNKAIADKISESKNIVIFTGAGISTNAGIPDFRSPSGLYSLVEDMFDLPYPEAIFDIKYFKKNPEPFFKLSAKLFAKNPEPTLCHKFIAWLEAQGKVSLVMTQNIDMLHQAAGTEKIHECHGSYSTAACMKCGKGYIYSELRSNIRGGTVPECSCGGIIKPDVVFFGEQLPQQFYHLLRKPPKADLLIIMGTSLKVFPSVQFAIDMANKTESILVNLAETEYDDMMTYTVHKDVDEFSHEIWDLLKNF